MSDGPETSSGRTANGVTQRIGRRAFVAGTGAVGATALGVPGVAASAVDESDDDETGEGTCGVSSVDSDPELIAHRGFAGVYPENTVGAVEAASRGGKAPQAASRGADSIEIDVLPTAEGDVVAFHDSRLAERDGGERGLTDTSGVVWETDTETVTNAEVLRSGETVPLLTDVLDAIPSGVGVNVELKNPGSFDLEFAVNLSAEKLAAQKSTWRSFVHRVLDVVDEYSHEFLFSSFYEAALAVTRANSSYPVAPLLWDSIEDGLDIARTYDAEAIHPPYNMVQGTPFYADDYYTEGSEWADIDLVSVADEEGRAVNVYTVGTWYQYDRLAAAGVDGVIADYPNLGRFGARDD
ncbi:glycerophosphodiester phosphodiesterase [Halomicroarcula sp. S1AR25-4]|uniref:glycerophosphodiester phosphodiesterase n=1 Tax=Haloarcula sp. S1AR25-4 TaxID=2950538 RepID=UPI0028751F95|nr:glycerophosphodiester phosphodiesterase [Halomicroarcula sp. S1AR25-4]MDS0279606.1 glycerophosphodiester phosphodiesterase [Halomicroarcula sp. S1AR25-4]